MTTETLETLEETSSETSDEFKIPDLHGCTKVASHAHLVAHLTGTTVVVDYGDGPVEEDPDPALYEPIMTGDLEYDMRNFADYEKRTAREYARKMNGQVNGQAG